MLYVDIDISQQAIVIALETADCTQISFCSKKATILTEALEGLCPGTKFFTIPWTNFLVGGGFRLGKGSILEALTGSLGKLAEVDLYQVKDAWCDMSLKIAECLLPIPPTFY